MFNKMRDTKVKVTKYDLRTYGVKRPMSGFSMFILLMIISALDYVTIFNTIDKTFNKQSDYMNRIVTAAIVFVLDILTITITEKIACSRSIKKSLPIATVIVVLATMVCMMIQRIFSADIIFDPNTGTKDLEKLVEEIIPGSENIVTTEIFHASPHQKIINILLGFLPIATTLFGLNMALRRGTTIKQVCLIRNRKETRLLNSQKEEILEYQNFDDDKDNEEKRDAMKNYCATLVQNMATEKNDELCIKLGDAQSVSYIEKNGELKLDSPANSNKNNSQTANNNNSGITQTSTPMPLQQQPF